MIELLPWDSEFFGFKVGRTELPAALKVGAEKVKEQMREMDIRLLYVFHNPKEVVDPTHKKSFLTSAAAKRVDQKVTYGKRLANQSNLYSPSNSIIPWATSQPTQQLYSLALQSGEYSRFKLDKGFSPDAFERLYRLWMDNSLNGTMADKVLIAPDANGEALGMVTVSWKGPKASIGLIAVDEKARGMKLGKQLMLSAEGYAREAGKKTIIVPTQLDNQAACRFYEHLGYEVVEVVEIWHVWAF